jgi:preprotein translocase subunit SecB
MTFSALQLKAHYFPVVNIRANVAGTATGKLEFAQDIVAVPEPGKPNQWHLEITLHQKSADKAAPFFYDVEIQVVGLVELVSEIPGDKELLARVNGLGILYGAAREMVLNVTARSLHGPLSLPVLNFVEIMKNTGPAPTERPAQSAPATVDKPPVG